MLYTVIIKQLKSLSEAYMNRNREDDYKRDFRGYSKRIDTAGEGLLETEFSGNEHWRMLKSHSNES